MLTNYMLGSFIMDDIHFTTLAAASDVVACLATLFLSLAL